MAVTPWDKKADVSGTSTLTGQSILGPPALKIGKDISSLDPAIGPYSKTSTNNVMQIQYHCLHAIWLYCINFFGCPIIFLSKCFLKQVRWDHQRNVKVDVHIQHMFFLPDSQK